MYSISKKAVCYECIKSDAINTKVPLMNQPKQYPLEFRRLPLNLIERDPNQPRRNFGTDGEVNRILLSIQQIGVQLPLLVSEFQPDRYIIIDGHRRYICSQKLELPTVPCLVYPRLPAGILEIFRYEAQNNRRPWKPLERAEALRNIQDTLMIHSNKELAAQLHISITAVQTALQLSREKTLFLELMASYGFSETYQLQFLHLKPKLRKVRNFEIDDIIRIIFAKVQSKIIRSSKEFVILGRVFLRATANEAEIVRFLEDPDATVSELQYRSTQTRNSQVIEQLVRDLTDQMQKGITFTSSEKASLKQLRTLLDRIL
jgi:ParB/RepB/Spo0J family partition protein